MSTSYVNFEELRRWLGLSESALRALVRRDQVPVQRAGRSLRFEVGEIESWLRRPKPATGSDKATIRRTPGAPNRSKDMDADGRRDRARELWRD